MVTGGVKKRGRLGIPCMASQDPQEGFHRPGPPPSRWRSPGHWIGFERLWNATPAGFYITGERPSRGRRRGLPFCAAQRPR